MVALGHFSTRSADGVARLFSDFEEAQERHPHMVARPGIRLAWERVRAALEFTDAGESSETADGQDELLVAVADLNMIGFWDRLPKRVVHDWQRFGVDCERLQCLARLVRGYDGPAANRIQHVLNPQGQHDKTIQSATDIHQIIY